MRKTEIQQKTLALAEAIKTLVSELTDEVAAEHVEELIEELAEEAIANHFGLLEDPDLDQEDEDEEPIDFYSDMDDFPSDD